jgi:hypothetical protein
MFSLQHAMKAYGAEWTYAFNFKWRYSSAFLIWELDVQASATLSLGKQPPIHIG